MATGLKVYNASGQVSFDTSRIGGVVLAIQNVGPSSPNAVLSYTYTVPAGSRARPIVLPSNSNILLNSVSTNVVGNQLTLTVVFPSSASTGLYVYILLLLF